MGRSILMSIAHIAGRILFYFHRISKPEMYALHEAQTTEASLGAMRRRQSMRHLPRHEELKDTSASLPIIDTGHYLHHRI